MKKQLSGWRPPLAGVVGRSTRSPCCQPPRSSRQSTAPVYEVVPIGITKQGRWVVSGDAERLLAGDFPYTWDSACRRSPNTPHQPRCWPKGQGVIVPSDAGRGRRPRRLSGALRKRGLFGSLQPTKYCTLDEPLSGAAWDLWRRWHHAGALRISGAGFDARARAGSGSATGMDKEVMKRLFLAAGLPITKHVTFLCAGSGKKSPRKIIASLSPTQYPLFVV